jgi:hypothetical protein
MRKREINPSFFDGKTFFKNKKYFLKVSNEIQLMPISISRFSYLLDQDTVFAFLVEWLILFQVRFKIFVTSPRETFNASTRASKWLKTIP